MENKIINRSMKGKLDKDVLHEQMENGVAIINNLSAY
jgi:hypothetical protein